MIAVQEHGIVPYECGELPPAPWLIFAPHPDDETFGPGGTLLLGAQAGIEVEVVVLTDGALGATGDPREIARMRRAEASAAAARLGVSNVQFWDEPDRGLSPTPALVERAAGVIRRCTPGSVFFPSVFDPHVDHRAAARLVWCALQVAVRSGLDPKPTPVAYEIMTQGRINRLFDVSEVYAEKERIMRECYPSQMAENDYLHVVRGLNAARTFSLPRGVTYAEGFYVHAPEDVAHPLEAITRRLLRVYWGREPEGWSASACGALCRLFRCGPFEG